MADVYLDLFLRHQERILEELRLLRSNIGDFRADMEAQSAIIPRLDQGAQSLTGEVRALAAEQDTRENGTNSCRASSRQPRASRVDRVLHLTHSL